MAHNATGGHSPSIIGEQIRGRMDSRGPSMGRIDMNRNTAVIVTVLGIMALMAVAVIFNVPLP
jgi:hypothetical protein